MEAAGGGLIRSAFAARAAVWHNQDASSKHNGKRLTKSSSLTRSIQNPDSPAAHVLVGEALDGVGKTAEAIAEFQAAAKAAPQEPHVHFGLGYVYFRLGRVYQTMGNKSAAQKEFANVRELRQKQDDVASKMPASPPALHP